MKRDVLTKAQRKSLDDALYEHKLIKLVGNRARPYAILKENVHGRTAMKRIVWNGSFWELGPLA